MERNRTVSVHGIRMGIIGIIVTIMLITLCEFRATAANLSDADKKELQALFKRTLLENDQSEYDISKYKFTDYIELRDLYEETIHSDDCILASSIYIVPQCAVTWQKKPRLIKTCYMYPTRGGDDFDEVYPKAQTKVNEILSGLTDDMTDADKALYIHDRVCEMSDYLSNNTLECYYPYNIWRNGKGNCAAMTVTYNIILQLAGIECIEGHGPDHVWTIAKLDGKWYNIDLTWDNHIPMRWEYFCIPDKTFKQNRHHQGDLSKDRNGNTISCTDNKYVSSFITKIPKGTLLSFKDGKWNYTTDDGKIYAGKLTDTNATLVNPEPSPAPDPISDPTEDPISEPTETPEPVIEPEPIPETPAAYYLCKGNRTNLKSNNYISLGKGTIKEKKTIKDDEDAIIANLGTVPEYEQYLKENQRVQWYSIKKEGDGWHVDGQIITEDVITPDEPEVTEEPTSTTPAEEPVKEEPAPEPIIDPEPIVETKAAFYLCKGDRKNLHASNYISLGKGTITKTETIKDDEDAINSVLCKVPDYSQYLSENQKVQWYSVKKENDGWHVDGQIVTIK